MVTAATQATRRRKSRPPSTTGHRSLLAISGALIALFGVMLTIISASSSLNSSSFVLAAGLGLILSGALLAKRHVAGVWTYLGVFASTLAWSLEDAGLGGSTIPYRILGPIVLLVMLALLMPALGRWSRPRIVGMLAVLIIATVLIGDLSDGSDNLVEGTAIAMPHGEDAQSKGILK